LKLEELIQAYNDKTMDAAEFYAAEYQLRRSVGFGMDFLDAIPSHPNAWRRLGFNLRKAFTRKVLEKIVEREQETAPKPSFFNVRDLLFFLKNHDGWLDMPAMSKSIKAHIDLENKQEYKTDLGETFHLKILFLLKDMEEKWMRRLDDVSVYACADERSEANEQLSAVLDSIAWWSYLLSGKAVETADWVGKPETVHVDDKVR